MTNENQNPTNPQADEKAWDDALSARLGQLRSAPADLNSLRAKIDSQIQQKHPKAQVKNPILRMIWTHHLQAIAALFILVILAGVVVNSLTNPSIASAQEMFQVHDDLVAGKIPVSRVTSIEDAAKVLSTQSAQSPALPDVPKAHVMACCMKSIKGRQMACVLLDHDGVPVTMTVASAADMQAPASEPMEHQGEKYHVQSVHGLNMVMTERNGRWVCLISSLPADQLMEVAHDLRF